MPRDDPLPLATMAAELLSRAAAKRKLPDDPELQRILADLSLMLPILRADEPHVMLWSKWATAMRESDNALREREKEKEA